MSAAMNGFTTLFRKLLNDQESNRQRILLNQLTSSYLQSSSKTFHLQSDKITIVDVMLDCDPTIQIYLTNHLSMNTDPMGFAIILTLNNDDYRKLNTAEFALLDSHNYRKFHSSPEISTIVFNLTVLYMENKSSEKLHL